MNLTFSSPGLSRFRSIFALIGAPVVWLLQVTLCEVLASRGCYPAAAPLDAPLWPWLMPALIAINLVCVALGGHAVCSARLMNRKPTLGATAERERFLARIALLSSGIFFIGIVFTVCAVLILSPCHRWP